MFDIIMVVVVALIALVIAIDIYKLARPNVPASRIVISNEVDSGNKFSVDKASKKKYRVDKASKKKYRKVITVNTYQTVRYRTILDNEEHEYEKLISSKTIVSHRRAQQRPEEDIETTMWEELHDREWYTNSYHERGRQQRRNRKEDVRNTKAMKAARKAKDKYSRYNVYDSEMNPSSC